MIRIYLDWNVFAILRTPTHALHTELTQKLAQYKDYIFIPYSPAHIQDLEKGWDGTPEKDALTRKDLKFISQVTGNNFFVQYWKEQFVTCHLRDPEEYFDATKETKKESLMDIMNFDKITEGLDLSEEELAAIEVPLKAIREAKFEFENYPGEAELKQYDQYFPVPRNGQLMMDYIKEFAQYAESLMNDPKKYKEVRDMFQKLLGIDPGVISNFNTNTTKKLNEFLPTTPLGITFTEHLQKHSTKKPTENKLYDELQTYYTTLDQVGFHNEGINKKNTFQNFHNDSQHAYFAAHCDVFLTCDGNTAYKSKAAYENFGVGTKVYHPEEFIKSIDGYFNDIKDRNKFEEILKGPAANDFSGVDVFDTTTKAGAKHILFELPSKLLGYFNLGDYISSESVTFIEFHGYRGKHDQITLYKEISAITNLLCDIFEEDLHGLGKFNSDLDIKQIKEDVWKGRGWVYGEGFLSLQYSVKSGLKLTVFLKKNQDL